jgi:hypothetical protein
VWQQLIEGTMMKTILNMSTLAEKYKGMLDEYNVFSEPFAASLEMDDTGQSVTYDDGAPTHRSDEVSSNKHSKAKVCCWFTSELCSSWFLLSAAATLLPLCLLGSGCYKIFL